MDSASPSFFGVSRAVFLVGALFALNAVVNVATFVLFGTADGVRNRAPIDLLPMFGVLVLVMAISADMGQKTLKARLTMLERICLYVLLAAMAGGLAFNAVNLDVAIDGLVVRMPLLLLAISVYYLLCLETKVAAMWISAALALQTLLHLPLVAALYVSHVNDPMMNWLGGPVGFWHVRIWGMSLAAGLAAALGLYAGGMAPDVRFRTLIAAVVFVLMWTALFWSGTRSGFVGLVAATVVSCLLFPKAFLRVLPLFIACAVAGAALSLLLDRPLSSYGLLESFGRRTELEGLEAASGGRIRMWTGAIGQFGEHPLVGFGFNQFFDVANQVRQHVHPHNAVVQLVFDFGLVGGGAAVLLLASLWLRAIGPVVREQQTWKYGALTALHALMVMSMFDGVLYHLDPMAMVALCFAVLFSRPADARPAGSP